MVVLLRGINVGGRNKVPMAELRQLATDCGLANPRTYIQSGNLAVSTASSPAEVEAALEAAITAHFGFTVSVIARTGAQWLALLDACPWPDAAAERPKWLHAGLCKATPAADTVEGLAKYVRGEERAELGADALWLDYAAGVGRSKLTPKVLDRAAGTPVTCRNWRTMEKLAAMVRPV